MEELQKNPADLAGAIKETFGLEGIPMVNYSPLTLSFVGDAVFEIIVRTLVVAEHNTQVSKLHNEAVKYVKADAQRALYKYIEDELTEEEKGYFRRGRNSNPKSVAKHATISDYNYATGFESLCGFLYLSGQTDRLLSLIKLGLDRKAADQSEQCKEKR